jgi:hypothetical protein
MPFQSFAEALKICLTAEPGSREQDEALIYCMEHAPDDLKEILKTRFVEFHTGDRHEHKIEHREAHEHGDSCGCGGNRKPKFSDFIR